ncbi:hypothetical protein ACU4GD_31735 [Cupriavidus basilensis]
MIHAEHHWDGINDFHESEEARDRLLAADLTEIEAMVGNKEAHPIRLVYRAGRDPKARDRGALLLQVDRALQPRGLGEPLLIDTGA